MEQQLSDAKKNNDRYKERINQDRSEMLKLQKENKDMNNILCEIKNTKWYKIFGKKKFNNKYFD